MGSYYIHVLVVVLSTVCFQLSQSVTVNEPVNINWQVGLPWDVSNTLRAPLGGPVSILLSAFMAGMLLFGLLLAPVNYILGYPSRIYHGYRQPGIFGRSFQDTWGSYREREGDFDMAEFIVESVSAVVFDALGEFYNYDDENNYSDGGRAISTVVGDNEWGRFPEFLQSIFMLVPEEDETCRKLLVCHAHGFLPYFPEAIVKLYKILSKNYITIPDMYKMAIRVGLMDQGKCHKVYKGCTRDLFYFTRGSIGVIRQSLLNYFPEGTKDLWKVFYAKYKGRH